jgi:diadenylate cyclase
VWLIAFVILFQPELRHALAQFGRTRYFRSFLRGDSYGVLGELVRGVETLAQRRHGALIVMERNVGLRNFVETGTRIDARLSAELLVTVFSPGSPLHDGALILREETIVAASCILPLSANPRIARCSAPAIAPPRTLGGDRRRVVVVSEETGASRSRSAGAEAATQRRRAAQRAVAHLPRPPRTSQSPSPLTESGTPEEKAAG